MRYTFVVERLLTKVIVTIIIIIIIIIIIKKPKKNNMELHLDKIYCVLHWDFIQVQTPASVHGFSLLV